MAHACAIRLHRFLGDLDIIARHYFQECRSRLQPLVHVFISRKLGLRFQSLCLCGLDLRRCLLCAAREFRSDQASQQLPSSRLSHDRLEPVHEPLHFG